ncbi:hypothetical protein DFJ43DRAFT_1205671 [Lentinula guzmanii]|uniref:Uncharacterized protein n=1 Tax=Lentinula guzmanii TaxID=2804957 RepID=A0AA38JCR1_9AGAR|nr:hypothetical protein DFJ43DRAFT_1205671 [Lentinula guzmanii]
MEIDPSLIPCPNFDSPGFASLRNAIIADPNTPNVTTNEEASQKLKEAWEADNQAQRLDYQTRALEREEQENEIQRQREAEDKQKEDELKKRDLELAQEKEKKRVPLYDFQLGQGLSSLPLLLHPYAQKKMSNRDYIELWYFTPEAFKEADRDRSTAESNRFELASSDDSQAFTLLGTHSTRPSSKVKPDEDLSWADVQRAKSAFLGALPTGGYPAKFVQMFASFYANLDMHAELRKVGGDRVIALYHAKMRRAWFMENKQQRPFDLAVIANEILQECRDEIRDLDHKKALKVSYQNTPSLPANTNNSFPSTPKQMLRYVIPRLATPCYATLCCAILCYAALPLATTCYYVLRHATILLRCATVRYATLLSPPHIF